MPAGDYVADHNSSLYYVSIDTAGEVGWESGTFRKAGLPDRRRKTLYIDRPQQSQTSDNGQNSADLPMPLYTFFEEYDFGGKTLIPFVTHGGSGFSGTIRTIKGLEPDAAVVEEGLSVSRNSVASAEDDVKAWAEFLLKD